MADLLSEPFLDALSHGPEPRLQAYKFSLNGVDVLSKPLEGTRVVARCHHSAPFFTNTTFVYAYVSVPSGPGSPANARSLTMPFIVPWWSFICRS